MRLNVIRKYIMVLFGRQRSKIKNTYFLAGIFLIAMFLILGSVEYSKATDRYDARNNYTGNLQQRHKKDSVFQLSTGNALSLGEYDGYLTFKNLKRHGNFGLGAPDGLDGEIVGFDNDFYQIRANGVASPINDKEKTPFATVKFFKPDQVFTLNSEAISFENLQQILDGYLPTQNIIYAIKIQGQFEYLRVRVAPKPSKPYPPLNEVVKTQLLFDFHNIEGTLVGFRFPKYLSNLNASPYHFHFISQDKKTGGHLLDSRMRNVNVAIDYTSEFSMELPNTEEFYSAELN